MSRYTTIAILICATIGLSGCEKRTAKFRVHDKVTVTLTDTRGEVVLRQQPFADDMYFIKVPGKKSALDREHPNWWFYGDDPDWHIEGPYHEADLVATR
jgi:hypothetical protein